MVGDQGRPPCWPAPLLADDQAVSSQFPGTARSSMSGHSSINRMPTTREAHNPPEGRPLLRVPPQ